MWPFFVPFSMAKCFGLIYADFLTLILKRLKKQSANFEQMILRPSYQNICIFQVKLSVVVGSIKINSQIIKVEFFLTHSAFLLEKFFNFAWFTNFVLILQFFKIIFYYIQKTKRISTILLKRLKLIRLTLGCMPLGAQYCACCVGKLHQHLQIYATNKNFLWLQPE